MVSMGVNMTKEMRKLLDRIKAHDDGIHREEFRYLRRFWY